MNRRSFLTGTASMTVLAVSPALASQNPPIRDMIISNGGAHFYTAPKTAKTAFEIRDWIYRKTYAVDTGNVGFGEPENWIDIHNMFYRGIYGLDAFACGGRAILYLAMLADVGFEARFVSVWEHPVLGNRSHASVDVWIDETHEIHDTGATGRWIASDPHFNVSFYKIGGPTNWRQLSWREAAEAMAVNPAGVGVTTNGYGQDHYMNMDWLFDKYNPAEMLNYVFSNKSYSHDYELYPASWDGIIRHEDGSIKTSYPAIYPNAIPYREFSAVQPYGYVDHPGQAS